MNEHLGDRAVGITDVHKRQDTEEKVHGCVEAGVQVDYGDNEPIAHKGREVEEEEDVEEDCINLGVLGEAQKNELRHRALVLPEEILHSPSAVEREMNRILAQLRMHINYHDCSVVGKAGDFI